MSKGCNRKERVTVRLTPGQMQCLKELSSNLNTSYSLLIRSIIQDFICRNEETLERIITNKQTEDAYTQFKEED